MATQAQITAFVNKYAPYAEQASQATGLNAQLILAQWGNETAYGTDFAEANNIGNVGVYGGGPNPSYGSVEAGVQAYINEINSPAMASVKNTAGQSLQAQAAALGASGYAGGDYNDGSGPGSSLIQDANVIAGAGFGSTSSVPAATSAGSASSQGAAVSGTTTAAPVSAPAPAQSVVVDGVTYTTPTGDANAASQTSAISSLAATLESYGFSGSDLNTLTNWAWGELTANTDPSQIAIDIQTPGSPVYPIFEKQFPGFTAANQELTSKGLQAVSVSQYQQYQTQATQLAQAAGLPPGFLNSQNIGTLVGNNVSISELTSRLNDATSLAINSTPEQRQEFNNYFGAQYQGLNDSSMISNGSPFGTAGSLTTGQIAALALDPNVAEPLIHQQIQAAQLGGAGVTAGIGGISEAEAMQIAQSYGGNLSQSQINSAVGNVAPLSPLESALPGNTGTTTVNADQLIGTQLLPTADNTRALQVTEEGRTAPFRGGGGLVQNSTGVVGAGSAKSSGAGQ